MSTAPETLDRVNDSPVIDPWEGRTKWQDAHPAITVDRDISYVTEAAINTLRAVDLTTGKVTASGQLEGAPNEIAVALD